MSCELFSHYHSTTTLSNDTVKIFISQLFTEEKELEDILFANVTVVSKGVTWNIQKKFSDFLSLDHIFHRCHLSREESSIKEYRKILTPLNKNNLNKFYSIVEEDFHIFIKHIKSSKCYSFMNWFEIDYKGRRSKSKRFVMMSITNPFPPLCTVVQKYAALAYDELSLEVGNSIYIYDFNAITREKGLSAYWAGKSLNGQTGVMLFPSSAVTMLSEKSYNSNFTQDDVIVNKNINNNLLKNLFHSRSKNIPLKKNINFKMFGVDIIDYLKNINSTIPPLLILGAQEIEQRGQVIGIYRTSSVQSALSAIKEKIECESSSEIAIILSTCEINDVANLLKTYFRMLPKPLINENSYEGIKTILSKDSSSVSVKAVRTVIKGLPTKNYSTLEYLLRHLRRMLLYEVETKMNVENLSIVWGPNISNFAKTSDLQKEFSHQTNLLKYLLINYPSIFEIMASSFHQDPVVMNKEMNIHVSTSTISVKRIQPRTPGYKSQIVNSPIKEKNIIAIEEEQTSQKSQATMITPVHNSLYKALHSSVKRSTTRSSSSRHHHRSSHRHHRQNQGDQESKILLKINR